MQQINLYLPEFQPNREPLRAVHMLWGAVILALLLVVASITSNASNKTLAAQVEQQRAQLEQMKRQLDELSRSQPQANLAQLDEEILTLRADLDRRQRLVSIVSNTNLGNSSGFSNQLRAMSRQALDTVSLEAFSLSRGGSYAEFVGKTIASDQVPLYVQRLRTEESFTNVGFGVLYVAPSEKKPGALDFSLAQPIIEKNKEESAKTAVQLLIEENEKNRSKQ